MENTIIIHTQYRENYGAHDWDGSGECPQYWKPKGGFTFQLKMDADHLFYAEEAAISAIKKMLEKQSNNYESFEYIEHEIQFNEPHQLDQDEFESIFKQECEKIFA